MDATSIVKAAAILEKLRMSGTYRLDHFPPDCRPETEEDGYRINDALHDRLTAAGYGRPIGYKLGCTTAVMQERIGCDHPTVGVVVDTMIFKHEAVLRHSDFRQVGCENEIIVRMAKDLPASGAPYDIAKVTPAVDTLMGGIELVESRYVINEETRKAHIPTVIADDFWGLGLIMGEPAKNWRSLDLQNNVARTIFNNEETGRGVSREALGHPLNAVAWLANHLAKLNRGLKAGDLISTGSLVSPVRPEAGQIAICDHGDLGRASLRMI